MKSKHIQIRSDEIEDSAPLPLRDLTVLEGDPEKEKPIGFKVFQYNGTVVHLIPPYMDIEDTDALQVWHDKYALPITEREGLQEGDRIIAWGSLAKVKKDADGSLYGQGVTCTYLLEFGGDDRNCWVCTGVINRGGLDHIRIRINWKVTF